METRREKEDAERRRGGDAESWCVVRCALYMSRSETHPIRPFHLKWCVTFWLWEDKGDKGGNGSAQF